MEELNYKRIPLMKYGIETGEYAKCSIIDYDVLSKFYWRIDNGYVVTDGYKNRRISMHKFVITVIQSKEIPNGSLIDHIDTNDPKNKLNNCRENLRIFTYSQNGKNKRKRQNTSSNFIGVSYSKHAKKYIASGRLNNKAVNIGTYSTEIEAAMARDAFIVQNNLIEEGFPLNFKDKIDELKILNIQKRQKLSKFRNIYKDTNGYYIARIVVDKKQIFYTASKNETKSAKKYDEFVVNNNLDKKLNFPEDYPNYIPQKAIKTFKEYIDDKICKIKLNSSKEKDKETIIDIESYDKIKYYRLTYIKNKNYESVNIKVNGKTYVLSRYLMNETNINVLIDHIDNNSLNNCISNFRISNRQRNSENKKKRKTEHGTNYVGVIKYGKKFRTCLSNQTFNYTKVHLTEEYAARDRDLQYLKRLPDSHYKIYFDWSIPGEIVKWEDLLFFEDLDMTVFNF